MLEYKGIYGTAKVMCDEIDEVTVSQIYKFLNHEAFTNPISIMPDTHAGKGAVIGFTMEMTDKIIPNVVGVDINCGVLSINMGMNFLNKITRKEIDSRIRERIPFGTSVHKNTVKIEEGFFRSTSKEHRLFTMAFNKKYKTSYNPVIFDGDWLDNKSTEIGMDHGRVLQSLGTLGGGNHFIELGISKNIGSAWFSIHSGSRQFGLKVCNYWQKKAGKGHLEYLQGDDMFGYLTDMVFVQKYAEMNRRYMVYHILDIFGLTMKDLFDCISTNHNFISFKDFIIRKGAISSYEGHRMVIPFNMEDGILICQGKSNQEWNYSAPHGAGRIGSRRWAKENLNLDKARKRMEQNDIYFSTLPIDELKGAYKNSKIIEEAIEPTATIIDRLKPILVMKEG